MKPWMIVYESGTEVIFCRPEDEQATLRTMFGNDKPRHRRYELMPGTGMVVRGDEPLYMSMVPTVLIEDTAGEHSSTPGTWGDQG